MKFKNLLVSGCSFTHNNGADHAFSWPHVLAQDLDLTVTNLSIPGAGNSHIANSIIIALEKSNLSPEDTLVMAMWSGIGRIDWITDNELSKFNNDYPFTYNYDEFNELVVGGNWWNIKRPSGVQSALINYSKYQSDKSLSLQSWLAMKNLYNYLKNRGFVYKCTSYLNIFINGINDDSITVNYQQELENLKLELDGDAWLPFDGDMYLGNYCQHNNYLWDDNFHPNWEGQQKWTREVLLPMLRNEGTL